MVSPQHSGSGTSNGGAIRFGEFEYDLRRRELRKHGLRIRLQNQPLAILLALTESPGAIVSREELRTRIWGANTFVEFEQGLNSAIKRLRDSLSDSAEMPRYVETVAGEGYRFICPVEVEPNSLSAGAAYRADATALVVSTLDAGNTPTKRSQIRAITWISIAAVFVPAAILVFLATHRAAKTISLSAQQLTFNTRELPVFASAISPDGRYLAYSDSAGLFLRDLHNSGNSERRMADAKIAENDLSWSADGTNIIASSPDGVRTVDALSAHTVELFADGFASAPSPAGFRAALWCGRHKICVVDTQSGEKLSEFSDSDPQSSWSRPVWSPDGHWIAVGRHWIGSNGMAAGIEIATPDGKNRTRIFEGAPLGGDFAWTPEGIFFNRPRKPPEARFSDLWFLRFDLRKARVIGLAYQVTNWPEFTFFGLSQTGDHEHFVFDRMLPRQQVYTAKVLNGGNKLAEIQPLGSTAQDNSPTGWSDNQTLLLDSTPHDSTVVGEQRLDADRPSIPWYSGSDSMSAVSTGDGKAVIYSTGSAIMRADRSGKRTLLFNFDGLVHFRCPVKAKMCFVRTAEVQSSKLIRRLAQFDPLVPGSPHYLPIETSQFNWWDADPAGHHIAISNIDKHLIEVYDLRGEKTGAIQFDRNELFETASFIPDGSALLATFIVGRGGRIEYVTARSRKIIWSSESLRLWSPVLAPDGRHVAFRGSYSESNIWIASLGK